jgi:hypothetical protein
MIWTICPETDLRLIANVSKRKWIPNIKATTTTTTTTTAMKSTRSGNSSATAAAAAEKEEEDHGKLESDVIVNKTMFATVRSQVLHHASAMVRAIGFLMHLQETRSSKRTSDIKPKVQFISLYNASAHHACMFLLLLLLLLLLLNSSFCCFFSAVDFTLANISLQLVQLHSIIYYYYYYYYYYRKGIFKA